MLRSGGISQICQLPPRSNHCSEGYTGTYPPLRCGISYTCVLSFTRIHTCNNIYCSYIDALSSNILTELK